MSKKKKLAGRPEFKVTPDLQRKVSIAAGGGMSHEEIAISLGISRNTMEKHFAVELSVAAYQRRIEVVNAMHKAALKGNVAAQKAYLSQDPRLAPPPAAEAAKGPAGKKEQRHADAGTAAQGTEWHGDLPRFSGNSKPH